MRYLTYMRISFADLCRWVVAGGAAVLTYFFGGADVWLVSLFGIVILDYISGVTAAALKHELSSKRGMAGILKKVLLFCVVGVSHLIDTATGAGGVLRALTIGFLLANEGISVLENAGRCGIPLPKKLLVVLEQLRDDGSDKEE